MLDPAEFIERFAAGDETTTGNPTGGPFGELPGAIESGIPPNDYETYDYPALATGAANVVRLRRAYQPEYWLVTLAPTANAKLLVYLGGEITGQPAQRLHPGWVCRIPGRGTDLTFYNAGSAAADVHVSAVRGYDVQVIGA